MPCTMHTLYKLYLYINEDYKIDNLSETSTTCPRSLTTKKTLNTIYVSKLATHLANKQPTTTP